MLLLFFIAAVICSLLLYDAWMKFITFDVPVGDQIYNSFSPRSTPYVTIETRKNLKTGEETYHWVTVPRNPSAVRTKFLLESFIKRGIPIYLLGAIVFWNLTFI